MVLIGRFRGTLLSFFVEHRLVEISLRHSSVVYRVVASHHIRTSDMTQSFVVESR